MASCSYVVVKDVTYYIMSNELTRGDGEMVKHNPLTYIFHCIDLFMMSGI